MIKSVAVTILAVVLFTSCSPSTSPADPSSPHALAEKRASIPWWRQLNDSSLNHDVTAAFSANPSLQTVALRINQADAAVAKARASTLPRLNLGFGYREGRRQEVDFGPYDLAPWKSSAVFSWEIDVTGKLRAAQNFLGPRTSRPRQMPRSKPSVREATGQICFRSRQSWPQNRGHDIAQWLRGPQMARWREGIAQARFQELVSCVQRHHELGAWASQKFTCGSKVIPKSTRLA